MQFTDQHPGHKPRKQNCATKTFTRPQIIKNVFILCAGVLLLFTAFDGLKMLQSTLNREGGIGVWSQAILYFCFSVSAMFLPKYVIKNFGTKITYVLSMATYIPYIALNFYFHWALVVPVSILSGLGAALIWGSQASYLAHVASMYVDNSMSKNQRNENDNMISIISNNIERETRDEIGKDIHSHGDYNMEKQKVHIKYYKTYRSSLHTIAEITSKPDTENYDNIIAEPCVQNNSRRNSFSNACYSMPFKSAEYFDVELNDDVNPKIDRNVAKAAMRNKALKQTRKKVESTTARFFGLHGVAYLTCHLWGNMITYFILKSDVDVDAVNNSSCVCGANFCNVQSACFEQNIEQPSDRIRYVLTGTCLGISVLAILVVVFFLDRLEDNKDKISISMDLVLATYNFAKRKEMLLLTPASFYLGMAQGFYAGDFTKSFIGCTWGTYHVGLVATSYGAFCGISSLSSGWLVKRVGRIPIFSVATVANIVAIALMLWWRPSAEEPAMFFVIAGLWGVYVGATWSQLKAFIGLLFKDDEEAAFAAFHVWYALGFSLSFAYSSYFCTYIKIYVLLVVCILGFMGYLSVELFYRKNKTNK